MTVFTQLALGLMALSTTGQLTLASIVSSANFVIGSIIIPGNIFLLPDSGTTTTNKVYVGTKETLGISAGGINSVSNGTQTGVMLKDNGTIGIGSFTITCTGTGGNVKVNSQAKYDTCFGKLPLSSTGVIIGLSAEFASTPVALGLDCGIVTTANGGTGTVLLNNVQATTCSTLYVDQAEFSGSLLPPGKIPGDQYLKCGTLTVPTTSFSGKLRVWYYDTSAD
jgi:hypothetical protein